MTIIELSIIRRISNNPIYFDVLNTVSRLDKLNYFNDLKSLLSTDSSLFEIQDIVCMHDACTFMN